MRRRRRSEPQPLGKLVHQVLGELGFDGTSALLRVVDRWEAIVGPDAARHCRPSALRGEVLEATADSSVWCQELQLRRPAILVALQRELGEQAPTDLWLRVG